MVFPASVGQPLFAIGDTKVKYNGTGELNMDPAMWPDARHVYFEDVIPEDLLTRMHNEAKELTEDA